MTLVDQCVKRVLLFRASQSLGRSHQRQPVATVSRSFAEVGALMSYGVDGPETSAGVIAAVEQYAEPAACPTRF